MQDKLEIDLAQLPDEGKAFSGFVDPKVFGLPERDAKPVDSLEFDLYAQRFDSELLLRGYLAAPFEFQCVRTNALFIQTISVEDAAISLEVSSGVVDATEAIREEVLIHFPAYPRCDEGDVPMDCDVDERYLALDKPLEDSVKDAPSDESADQWSALDGFKPSKEN